MGRLVKPLTSLENEELIREGQLLTGLEGEVLLDGSAECQTCQGGAPDTLDPALLRPERLDRKVEFGLPYLESRTQILKIHTMTMNCERDIRFELLPRLCRNSTGDGIRTVCTEARMFVIRAWRKTVTEKDFVEAVHKVYN